jgi:hypothetical protein
LHHPVVHRRPNVDPSEGRGCCCAPSRSQQQCSWSSPHRLIAPTLDPRHCGADSAAAARSDRRCTNQAPVAPIRPLPPLPARDTWRPRSYAESGGGSHSTAPSSVPFRGRSGRGAVPIRPSLLVLGRHPTRVAAPPSTITTTSTSATLASKGYHLHVVLIGFYSSHSIRAITTLQLRGDVSSSDSTFDLFLQSHRLWCSRCDCGGC